MKQVIENIRQKPPHQQNRIILFSILIIVAVLIIAWAIIGIPTRNKQNGEGDLLNKVNKEFNEGKTIMPEVFPKN